MDNKNTSRRAFTLVELLVVMVISGILSGLAAIALTGASRAAQESRARSMVDSLNLIMLQIYEIESERVPAYPGVSVSGNTQAMSALLWKRDWVRCVLPDRIAEVSTAPVVVPFSDVGPPVTAIPMSSATRLSRLLRARERIKNTIVNAKSLPAATSYVDLVDGDVTNGEWTIEYQSAECLHLILSSTVVNGKPASDMLRTRDIGDIDEDGMPEILDPWGVPFGFMRWPCGFKLTPQWNVIVESPASTTVRADWADLVAIKNELERDSIDTLLVDPRYLDSESSTPPVNATAEDPFQLTPMIVSAGSDGEFDLFGLDGDSVSLPTISFIRSGWPTEATSPITVAGFAAPANFVDPYLGNLAIGSQLGARGDVNGDGNDQSADNVYPAFGDF
ncbi:type II secretion system protein [Neorhodopirellula pilleata]|uniref:Type II secretion system protein G n=1 Tax=Neorhodopirellula pilleata TaxID=2714738 RepID=A0A5C6A2W4_9BACT|nr:type II secretion system protein [Neorhodopirellula pilleata]TWT93667.1 hypothetical protein Pla100_41850 [Neorhodopirellula pilleata]